MSLEQHSICKTSDDVIALTKGAVSGMVKVVLMLVMVM